MQLYDASGKPIDKSLISDEALLFGYQLFETIKVADGKPVHFELHFERLRSSAAELAIELKCQMHFVLELLYHYIEDRQLKDCAIRLTLLKQKASYQWYITNRPIPYTKVQYETGIKLTTQNNYLFSNSPLSGHKTANYLNYQLALQSAKNKGFDEVLLFNEQGFLVEAATANVFFEWQGMLHTAALSTGALPGTKRKSLLIKARVENIDVIEGCYTQKDVMKASSIWLTNAVMGVMPVRRLCNKSFSVKQLSLFKTTSLP